MRNSRRSARSRSAVPGEIAGIDAALKRFGTMKFQQVAASAIKLARDGFPVSEHLAGEIKSNASMLAMDPGLKEVFLKEDGSAPAAGDKIYAKKLADTMERLGNTPVAKFYNGSIGKELVSYLRNTAASSPMTTWRIISLFGATRFIAPITGWWSTRCRRRRQAGCVLEMLGMLEPGHLPGLGLNSPPYLARLIEVMRQGFIDRSLYADPVYVHVPLDILLSPGHINEARERALHQKSPAATGDEAHDHGTSNLCVVDEAGNVVAITTTINTVFGAKMTVPKLGIILNDEMDDFSVAPGVANAYKLAGADANSIAPGKRPLSSMTPIIVMKQDKPVLVAGGSGGPTIITRSAAGRARGAGFSQHGGRCGRPTRGCMSRPIPDVVLIEEKMPQTTRDALEQMRYNLRVIPQLGAVNAITIAPGNLHGAFDPRKGGGAAGY